MADLHRIEGEIAHDRDDWPRDPVIGPPVIQPLAFDPPTFIETPDYQRSGVHVGPRSPYMWRTFGRPYPTLMTSAQRRQQANRRLAQHKLTFPADSPERIRYYDELRCLDLPPQSLTPQGTAFELVRVHLQKFGTGVVERMATIFEDVTALDAGGNPIFSFGSLIGLRPCIFPLQHPDPAAGTLSLQFRLIVSELPDVSRALGNAAPYQGPVPVAAIPPDENMRPPWTELRQGYVVRWADLLQHVTGLNAHVRLWGVFFAQTNRWRLRVGGRLSGYWNSAGRMGVALNNATRRTL